MIPRFLPIDFESIDINRAGYVYLIHAEGTNRYKVGRSKHPITRMSDIQKQSPYKLILVNSFYTLDTVSDESFLHYKLGRYRVFGEWFEVIEKREKTEFSFACYSSFNRKIWEESLKIFSELGVDIDNYLFRKHFSGFFCKAIEQSKSPENFYYFRDFVDAIIWEIKDDLKDLDTGDFDANTITSYAAGLFSGAFASLLLPSRRG